MKKFLRSLSVFMVMLALSCTVIFAAPKPGRGAISKLTSTKKTVTVKYKKASRSKSYNYDPDYQIQIATNKTFTKGKITKKYWSWENTYKHTFKGLKPNKKYYVRVRGFYNIGPNYYYGKWSAIKTIKTKK